jgi:hypothetical protein
LKKKYPKLNSIERFYKHLEDKEKTVRYDGPLFDMLEATNGIIPLLAALVGVMLIIFSFFCGPAFASIQSRYGILHLNDRDLALIRVYDDRYLFVPTDQLTDPNADREAIVLTTQALSDKGLTVEFRKIKPFPGYSKALLRMW